jgi:hypothetical protein
MPAVDRMPEQLAEKLTFQEFPSFRSLIAAMISEHRVSGYDVRYD